MINEIKSLYAELQRTDFKGVAQYGIQATLPNGKGVVGKALENEVVRRSEKSKRIYEYIDQVNFINENRRHITDEKEKVVLDCLLDGFSISAIARHLRTGRKQVGNIVDSIVDQLAK